MDEARQTFASEVEELLQQMEEALLTLEEDPSDVATLHQLFRAIHTIKGAAGIFGFDSVVAFTHPVETLLDALRAGERQLDEALLSTLLSCRDHVAALVAFVLDDESGSGALLPPSLAAAGATLLQQLQGDPPTATMATVANSSALIAAPTAREPLSNAVGDDAWVITLQFQQDALRNGLDPLSFLRYLQTLGELVEVITLTDRIPPAAEMDVESCYLGFRIAFRSQATKAEIEGVFEFARDDCDIRILPPHSHHHTYLDLLEQMPAGQLQQLGQMLVAIGAITERELAVSLQQQSQQRTATGDSSVSPPIGEILVARQVVSQPVVEQALKRQEQAREQSRHIRVDADRLGQLINLVGELVIAGAAMRLLVDRHHLSDVDEVVSGVEHLVEEIRDHALQLRMVPIGDTFSRFRRVVRDVSHELEKQIVLQIDGAEAELDKTVVEKINDPLTHLVRNALDHGIESPPQRQAAGKPPQGTLHLNAYHESGHIVIEVKDDGAGLDPDQIRTKAESLGLIKPDQHLSRSEIFRLIFEPGLSTRQQVSNLSGRGVGMDVVKRNIEALRGSVEIDSERGIGTTVTIRLPLTLAIIDGFRVAAGGENYVLPLSMVEECVELPPQRGVDEPHHNFINLRGELLPTLRLQHFFADTPAATTHPIGSRESLVVVRFGRIRAGLVVDSLHGELQTVIKPLGELFQNIRGISGATILGNGAIALILDVQELVRLAHDRGEQHTGNPSLKMLRGVA